MAVADASFNTSMLAMSSGLMSLSEPLTWPSIMIRGLPEPSKLVPPRNTIDGKAPGRPVPVDTRTPAIVPASACAGLERKPVPSTLVSSLETEEVTLERLAVPYPMTTTSSILPVAPVFKETVIVDAFPTYLDAHAGQRFFVLVRNDGPRNGSVLGPCQCGQ